MTALRALLVEDSESDAKLVARTLRGLGDVEIIRVETEAAMRAALEGGRIDFVLSDWSMPAFSALDALALLRATERDLPFIIVSGTIGEEVAVEAMRAGAHDYVLKDRLARLVPAVEREMREAAVRAARAAERAALDASEARYRRIVETTSQGVWMLDASGKTTFVNERMASMLGYTREELAALPASSVIDVFSREMVAERARAATRGAIQTECQLRHKDGSAVWVMIEASPLVDERGQAEGRLALVLDITGRKRSEEALRITEARLGRLWESGLVGIFVLDVEGVVLDLNGAAATLLDRQRTDVISRRIMLRDLVPSELGPLADRAAAEILETGKLAPFEAEVAREGGERVSIIAGAGMIDADTSMVIAIDVSERKRAQRELLERVEFQALTGEVSVALANADPLDRILQRCALAIAEHLDVDLARIWTTKTPTDELLLKASAGPLALTESPAMPTRPEVLRIASDHHPCVSNDAAHDLADPPWFEQRGLVSFAGHPLLVAGKLVGVVAVYGRRRLSPATLEHLGSLASTLSVGVQRKLVEEAGQSLEAQLRHAQKMEAVGRLAGGIAHDFNNVLSVILSYAELILGDLPKEDPVAEDVREMHKAGMRAADLTRHLLMFSRQQIIEPRAVHLGDVLAGMDKMLRRLLGEDVALAIKVGDGLGHVLVDPGSVEQIVMNLVVNARDAMPRGGRLEIATENAVLDEAFTQTHLGAKPGAYVKLSVTDNGVGMDAATMTRIFEPFYTTKERGKGTGLGLSTVFGIVRRSNGFIWVDSEQQVGTTFTIHLPRVDGQAVAATSAPPTTLRGTETILLAEDEEQVRAVARDILQRAGYTVLEARTPEEAIAIAESPDTPIDLLLTDVVMPQMSGPELAKQVKARRPQLKVLCMSGYAEDATVRHGVIDAGLPFLQKPITVEGLTKKVRAVLDGPLPEPRLSQT